MAVWGGRLSEGLPTPESERLCLSMGTVLTAVAGFEILSLSCKLSEDLWIWAIFSQQNTGVHLHYNRSAIFYLNRNPYSWRAHFYFIRRRPQTFSTRGPGHLRCIFVLIILRVNSLYRNLPCWTHSRNCLSFPFLFTLDIDYFYRNISYRELFP